MSVWQAALIAALVAAPVASAAAGPAVRLGPAPIVIPHGIGERHAFWRGGDGDHDFWRHHHRQVFVGPIGGVVSEAVAPGPEPTPSPFVGAAPIFVNVTFTPAVGPRRDWTDGPKLIEIGRRAAPQGHLPLLIYGD